MNFDAAPRIGTLHWRGRSRATMASPMRDMVPMTLDDLSTASFRFDAAAELPCSPARLFDDLGEPESWPRWFPLMRRARWTSAETACVGARREVAFLLLGSFEETILAFEPGARVAFTMIRTSSPLPARMAEDYRIYPIGDGCRLEWTVVSEPTRLGRVAQPTLPLLFGGLWRAGAPRLRRRLASGEGR